MGNRKLRRGATLSLLSMSVHLATLGSMVNPEITFTALICLVVLGPRAISNAESLKSYFVLRARVNQGKFMSQDARLSSPCR